MITAAVPSSQATESMDDTPPSVIDLISSSSSSSIPSSAASTSSTLSLLTSPFSSLHIPSTSPTTPPFSLITTNLHHPSLKRQRAISDEFGQCSCAPTRSYRPTPPCADDGCDNRSLCIECASPCPSSGPLCRNQRFTRREWSPDISVQLIGGKGYGVIATHPIPAHTLVIEYVGEVIPASLVQQRLADAARDSPHYYLLTLSRAEVIDATRSGNRGRFINHACGDNNCETVKWKVRGRDVVGIFTSRGVEAGEELTFDYNWQRRGGLRVACHCNKPGCRGWLGEEEKGKPNKRRRRSPTRSRDDERKTAEMDSDSSNSEGEGKDDDDEEKEEEEDEKEEQKSGETEDEEEVRTSPEEMASVNRQRGHDNLLYVHLAEKWLRALDEAPPSASSSSSSASSLSTFDASVLARCRAARARQLEALLDEVEVEDERDQLTQSRSSGATRGSESDVSGNAGSQQSQVVSVR